MQHLDDAQIAAYLDGQTAPEPIDHHLTECATCRSRVDAERAVRTRASAILDDGGPGTVVTPSFDEVLIRAGRKPARRRPRVPLRALAWAATIMLAFGAGWVLRRPGIARKSASPPIAQGLVARAPTPPSAASSLAAAPATAPSPSAAEATRPTTELKVGSPSAAAKSAATPVNGMRQAKAAKPPALAEGTPLADSSPATPMALANQPAGRRTEVVAAPPERIDAGREAVAQTAAAGLAADALEQKAEPWLPLETRTEAEQRLGASVAAVGGLEARYAVSPGTPAWVRVEQPLGDGAMLVLIEVRVLSDTTRVTAPRRVAADSGFSAVELVRDGTRIRATAPISSDSLLALLRRLD